MADFSFDVVSRIDPQELDNALNQTRKEIAGRFDFKGSNTTIEDTPTSITIQTSDELKMKNVVDILQGKAVKRGISLKSFELGKIEPAAKDTVRQVIALKRGIPKDKSKALIDAIKAAKLKVAVQYQDE